jgi:hypothetical protein
LAIKQDLAFRWLQKAGDDIEKGGFATTRGAEQGIGAAVLPIQINFFEGKVIRALGIGVITVP